MQKKAYPAQNQISPEEKQKTLQCFLFQNGSYRTPKTSPRKVSEQIGKISFHTKNRHSVPSSSTLFVRVNIVGQLYSFFFVLTSTFRLSRGFESFSILFHIGIWLFDFSFVVIFVLSRFCFSVFWGPMEATFLSWILSSGLNCARELRASNLKHQDCCSYHLQTCFVESNVVRQLDSRFLSF